jgi:hypothetical protein
MLAGEMVFYALNLHSLNRYDIPNIQRTYNMSYSSYLSEHKNGNMEMSILSNGHKKVNGVYRLSNNKIWVGIAVMHYTRGVHFVAHGSCVALNPFLSGPWSL